MEKDDIIIRNAIVHILDSKVGMPVLSDLLLETGSEMNDFIRGHIFRIASGDECKQCTFHKEESLIYKALNDFNEENLIPVSKEICTYLYGIMNSNIDIPSADVMIVTYQVFSTVHMAILKMNYKETYIHQTASSEECSNYNNIIKQTATLPSAGSRLTEAALINLSDYSIVLTEKKYDINGKKINYFSEVFLQCGTKMSEKSKLNIVTKAVEQVNKKFYEDNPDKKMKTKSIIQNEIVEQGAINVEQISEKLYGDVPEIKEEFTEKLKKYNVEKDEVKPQNVQTVKKFEKQYLTTDQGIEINIPMEEYNTGKNVEFLTNEDGTISVLIKNINWIDSK